MRSRTARLFGVVLGLTIVFSMGSTAFASATALDPISVLSTSFDDGVPTGFSGITTTEGVQRYAGLGTDGNVFAGDFLRNDSGDVVNDLPPEKTTLTLTDLPAHDALDLGFLLGVIDSWDGETCSGFTGPDSFNVTVDGEVLFSEVFSNSSCSGQTYFPPEGVELARQVNLGFNTVNGDFLDCAYNMGLDATFQDIPHASSTLTVEWFAGGEAWQGGTDESWAIDNVEVVIHPVEVDSEPDDPAENLPDTPDDVTPEAPDAVGANQPEVAVLPRRLARTDASPLTPWLLGLGLGSLGLGVTIRRRVAARG